MSACCPHRTEGKSQRVFTGREDPPVLEANVPGRTFLLKASRTGLDIARLAGVLPRLSVGEVLGWDIGDMAESVTIRAFVRAPYDTTSATTTKFWNASGVSLKLGASRR